MTSDEVWDLLELIASIDRRKVGLTDRQTWQGLVGDLSAADAQAAVIGHYADSTEWIMPAHVRTRVKAMRRDRLAREIVPAPPPEDADNPVRFRGTLKADLRAIGDGLAIPKAIGGPVREDDPPPTWAEARAQMPTPRVLTPQEKALQQAAESRAAREADEGEPGSMITVTVDNDAERDAMMCALFVRDFDYRITHDGQPVAWCENGTYGGYAATEGRPVA